MSSRQQSIVIKDILSCISRIQQYTNGLTFDEFSANFMVTEACLYNIQVIGEAVAQLSDDIKQSQPQIPWVLIKNMRNRLIHQYFGTDLTIIWNVITNELPSLKQQLLTIHEKLLLQGR